MIQSANVAALDTVDKDDTLNAEQFIVLKVAAALCTPVLNVGSLVSEMVPFASDEGLWKELIL